MCTGNILQSGPTPEAIRKRNGLSSLCVSGRCPEAPRGSAAHAVHRWLIDQDSSVSSELPDGQGVWHFDDEVNICNTHT
ncbi:hypothetical protein F7725_012576 [Dissostichus mawsoni]|uniref:Uncharacterized protein n=1 Tax=Dissostichus mawsoni TaxID=36200 RepID=A0A7J5YMP4_DISMA|nr:hypothetical protein F7725_012576 [Dissostichus mawsoni]